MSRRENGFTLVEVLVTILVFSVISVGFYTVMFSGTRGSDTARHVIRISEDARLGLNRMVRDTREADEIVELSPTAYRIQVNFNNNFDAAGDPIYEDTNAASDEDFSFVYDAATSGIYIDVDNDGPEPDELLVGGVSPIGSGDPFSYFSNVLELDWHGASSSDPPDGVTTCLEIDEAEDHGVANVGDDDGVCDDGEAEFVSRVRFAFEVASGDHKTDFFTESQLRNFVFQPAP